MQGGIRNLNLTETPKRVSVIFFPGLQRPSRRHTVWGPFL